MRAPEKDQRVRITKMLIVSTFLKLLAEKPVQNITVRELCESAQINRGTFYSHYLDIYDLLEQIENEFLDVFKASISRLMNESQNLADTNVNVAQSIFKMLKENAELCMILLGDNGSKGIINKFTDAAKEVFVDVYSGFFPEVPQKKLERYYVFVSSGAIALLREWFLEGMSTPVSEIGGEAGKIMQYGAAYLQVK